MTTVVHRFLPGSKQTGTNEVFPDGCGPYAACRALNTLEPENYPITIAVLNSIKQTMVDRGWWIFDNNGVSGGCNVQQLANYITEVAGYNVQFFSSYGQGGALVIDEPGNVSAMRQVMQQKAGIQPMLFEPDNGSALVGNQLGVERHWVAPLGINSDPASEGGHLGYLIANGDEIPNIGPQWTPWSVILASQPIAFLIIWQKRQPPTPPAFQPDVPGAVSLLKGALQKLGG